MPLLQFTSIVMIVADMPCTAAAKVLTNIVKVLKLILVFPQRRYHLILFSQQFIQYVVYLQAVF